MAAVVPNAAYLSTPRRVTLERRIISSRKAVQIFRLDLLKHYSGIMAAAR